MTVLLPPAKHDDLEEVPLLTTKLVMDWRWRENKWTRRERLVARDFAWRDPNRTDVFAPAGFLAEVGSSDLSGQRLEDDHEITMDVKDAYLMCAQPKKVKVSLDKALAERLGLQQEWILGRILPGQREGAAQWFQELRRRLIEAGLTPCAEAPTLWKGQDVILLVHVDDMILGGEEKEVARVTDHLMKRYKVSVEDDQVLSFLKRTLMVDASETKMMVNEKYIHNLAKMMSPVKKSKTPGAGIEDGKTMEENDWRRTLLYMAGDRPDIQLHVKELAGRLQSPTEGAWKALEKLVGYLATTTDVRLVMRSQTKSNSFRNRTRGLTTAPMFEEAEHMWLLEVTCDSDWSGNKQTRSSTSAGCIFLAGNWIHSYARTQKNITLSSTETEYVALVSGASEGLLLKAAVEHLTGEQVKLVIYGDNSSSIAIAQKEGVGKLKHLSGRLLWLQPRQSKDLDLRKLETATSPSDIGAKTLGGKRINMLMYIMGFADSSQQLGKTEFEAERAKAEQKRRLQEVRRMVFAEEGTPEEHTGKPVGKEIVEAHDDSIASRFSLGPGPGRACAAWRAMFSRG